MSVDKGNYEFYKSTFNKVHASDELVRKVKEMTEVKAKNKIYTIRKAFCVAAAAALIFAASNVAVYAATGESWVEKIAVRAIFNGEEKQIELDKITDENGDVSYKMKLDLYGTTSEHEAEDGTTYSYPSYTIDTEHFYIDGNSTPVRIEFTEAEPVLVQENDRVYLEISSAGIKEDITEDFADGKASIVVIEGENELVATVEGTVDSYTVDWSE